MESAQSRQLTEDGEAVEVPDSGSSSPRLQSTGFSSPLHQLHKPLRRLSRAAQNLRDALSLARGIADQWSLPWRTRHPEQDALRGLLSKIDSAEKLDSQLVACINAIQQFDENFHQQLILHFVGTANKNKTIIERKIAEVGRNLQREFDKDCAEYAENIDKLISYRENVRKSINYHAWIGNDLVRIKQWIEDASDYNASLTSLEAELENIKLDLPQALSVADKRLDDGSEVAATFQTLQAEATRLLEEINVFTREKIDEEKIKAQYAKLQDLERLYTDAKSEYQSQYKMVVDCSDPMSLGQSSSSLESDISNCLSECDRQGKVNEENILSSLQRYHNAEYDDGKEMGRSIADLLTKRSETSLNFNKQLEDLRDKANQQLDRVKDAKEHVVKIDEKYVALKLPSENRMSIDQVMNKNWQYQALDRLKTTKLGEAEIKSSQNSFSKQFAVLAEKELKLIAMIIENLNLLM
jgi:hypothetical protein